MNRVVLFFPDHHDVRRAGRFQDRQILPLGTLAIATPLTAAGFSVEIIDQRVNEDWRAKVRAAAAAKPVFFGVSSMTGVQIKGGLQASRIVKEVAPDVPVVWGGVHPSLLPDQTLAHPDVDIVVIGEGDATAPDLARALVEGRALDTVDGLGFKRDGAPLRTKPRALLEVEKLPSTDYTLIPDIDAYKVTAFYTGKASLAYQSSRGCAHPCGYCYNLEFNDMRFRARSPARVVDEIENLITRFDLKAVFMLDDNFFQSKRRVGEIAERILARGLDVEFYNANCRIDYISRYDVEFLKMLGRAGIRELRIGIESGSNTTQQRIDKYTTFDECLVANRKLREAGIVPHYNFMVGFPEETLTEVSDTLRLMDRLLDENPDAFVYNCSLFSPYPGTPLYDVAVGAGWTPPSRLEDWVTAEFKDLNVAATPAWSRYICDVHEFSGYIDAKHRGRLGRMYSKVARARIRRGWVGWLPEARFRRLVRNGMGILRKTSQPFSEYRERPAVGSKGGAMAPMRTDGTTRGRNAHVAALGTAIEA